MVACCCCGFEEGKPINNRPRGCTDIACFALFLLCLAAQVSLMVYGFVWGDPRIVTSLPDSQGRFCGVSPLVADKPFLFFCQDATGTLNWTAPMCVSSCPNPDPLAQPIQRECPFGKATDYPSQPFMGELCVPKAEEMAHKLAKWVWKNDVITFMMNVGEAARAWNVLAISVVISIMVAFGYLFFLEKLAFVLLWIGIAISVLTPAVLGSFAIWCAATGGLDHIPGTGDAGLALAVGISLCVLSLVFAAIAFFKADKVNLAVECIKATCECIRDMPTLLFEPVVSISIKLATVAVLAVGFIYLASVVDQVKESVVRNTGITGFSFDEVQYTKVKYSTQEYFFLTFYVCMSIWIMEFSTALSQFAVSYAVSQWFLSHHKPEFGLPRNAPTCASCRGLVVGLVYHAGTLAFGSFLISCTRWLRMLLEILIPHSEGGGNPISDCLLKVCVCCVVCFEKFLRFVNKNAYMEVAINGGDFCQAAHQAMLVMSNELVSAAILNGATWLFQLTGLVGIASSGALVAFLMCTHLYVYCDPLSAYYVTDPLMVTGVAFVLCFLAALPFMIVFDHVSDTILYCFALDEKEGGGKAAKVADTATGRPEMQALLRAAQQRPGVLQ